MKKFRLFVTISLLSCMLMACSEENSNQSNHSGDVECKDRCEDSVMHYCNGTESQCSYGCNTTGTACNKPVSCKAGCSDGVLTTCNGSVASTQNCPSGACNSAGTDCEAPSGGCVPGCKFGQLTTCTGGVATTQNCPSRTCNMAGTDCAPENTCTPSCRDGVATVCNGGVASQEQCTSRACNAQQTGCQIGGGGTCESPTKCSGNILHVCDVVAGFQREFDFNCANYDQTCSSINGVADCRNTCTNAGDIKVECNRGGETGSYTMNYVCTKADDNNLYWLRDETSQKSCNAGYSCNDAFTACVPAEECNPSTYPASCTNNVAKSCSAFQIVQTANCTRLGKACAKQSSTKAECVDVDMKCTTPGSTKRKCGVSDEVNLRPVSTVYTCKADAEGNLYYLDGHNEACGIYGCDESTGNCITIDNEENQPCNPDTYLDHCNGSRAIYCSQSRKVTALECNEPNEPGFVCLTVQNSAHNAYANCFLPERDSCTKVGEQRFAQNGYGVYTDECSLASDGNLYWAEIAFTEH